MHFNLFIQMGVAHIMGRNVNYQGDYGVIWGDCDIVVTLWISPEIF